MAAGSIAQAVARREIRGDGVPVEVEVENLQELRGRRFHGGRRLAMLDDFSLEAMAEAVAVNRGAPKALEARGVRRRDARLRYA